MGPADLSDVLNGLKRKKNEKLIVGFETSDDASIFALADDKYMVQTVDFITPVVDDAYTFGRISALNSMSDVYAMGGKPVTALSVLSYNCDIGPDMIKAMIQGALDEAEDAGCVLSGGHTIDDTEIKFGLSVTGLIEDGKFYKNVGLRTGDKLIYTKKLGIGVLTTALKFGRTSDEDNEEVTKEMLISNRAASELLRDFDVSACTDITGFGLAGHSYEMASGSGVSIKFDKDSIPFMKGAVEFTKDYIIPGGLTSNIRFLDDNTVFEQLERNRHFLFFDPQTSGGLLIGVSEKDSENMLEKLKESGYPDAAIIGSAVDDEHPKIYFD